MRNVNVVKIGASVTDSPEVLEKFLHDFSRMTGDKILVHGGGREATRLAEKLGVETRMVDGRRITSPEMLDVAVMVYAGLVNKRIVAHLQALSTDAIGLCGADADCITAVRRPPVNDIDYGMVGDIEAVNGPFFTQQLDEVRTPVVCAIAHDGKGQLLNCNADGVARAVALGMVSMDFHVTLTYCIDQPGVLSDLNNPQSVIPEISSELLPELIEQGTITEGMLPKVNYALEAAKLGIAQVVIKQASDLLQPTGTYITA